MSFSLPHPAQILAIIVVLLSAVAVLISYIGNTSLQSLDVEADDIGKGGRRARCSAPHGAAMELNRAEFGALDPRDLSAPRSAGGSIVPRIPRAHQQGPARQDARRRGVAAGRQEGVCGVRDERRRIRSARPRRRRMRSRRAVGGCRSMPHERCPPTRTRYGRAPAPWSAPAASPPWRSAAERPEYRRRRAPPCSLPRRRRFSHTRLGSAVIAVFGQEEVDMLVVDRNFLASCLPGSRCAARPGSQRRPGLSGCCPPAALARPPLSIWRRPAGRWGR